MVPTHLATSPRNPALYLPRPTPARSGASGGPGSGPGPRSTLGPESRLVSTAPNPGQIPGPPGPTLDHWSRARSGTQVPSLDLPEQVVLRSKTHGPVTFCISPVGGLSRSGGT